MSILIRPAAPEDAESLAILSQGLYRPDDAAAWRKAAHEQASSGLLVIATELVTEEVRGYGYARPDLPGHPDVMKFRLHIGVQPDSRRQGIGARLYEALLLALRASGTKTLRARVPGIDAASLAFLNQRDFSEYQRMCHLTLDLRGLQVLTLTVPDGICISTLAEELERRPNCLAAVHALQNECFRDVPSADPFHPHSYEAFSRSLQDPLLLLACFFLAREGETYVGLSYAATTGDAAVLDHRFTGVLRAYRGRGIARALKWWVTNYALNHSYQRITTATLQTNLRMQAVNKNLGFTLKNLEVRLQRQLDTQHKRQGGFHQA